MRVGITGHTGLLGWHLGCRLHVEADITAATAGRPEFSDPEALGLFVDGCDAIIHFAGMNRGDGAEIDQVNRTLAEALVQALRARGATPHVIFSSSTHIERDTSYGRSKRAATATLRAWAETEGAPFTNLVLPHVFGEEGKPFHNSVVSTFCHELAAGRTPEIENDGALELLHAGEVASLCLRVLRRNESGEIRPRGREMLVSEMLDLVSGMTTTYTSGVIPLFADPFELRMFNTLRSYLYPSHYPVVVPLRSDPRGVLFEAVKTHHGGQAFVSTTRPDVTRGEHFHFEKVERFLVVSGEAVIRLRRLLGDEVVEFPVTGEKPSYIDMPTLHAHSITNVGESELLTLFWTHEIFDPENPDTYPEPVLRGISS